MKRPEITLERFEEILAQTERLYFIVHTVNYDFEENEIFIMISMILAKISDTHSNGNEEEGQKNMEYLEKCLSKIASVILKKEK